MITKKIEKVIKSGDSEIVYEEFEDIVTDDEEDDDEEKRIDEILIKMSLESKGPYVKYDSGLILYSIPRQSRLQKQKRKIDETNCAPSSQKVKQTKNIKKKK
ncbi:MAG: hypothetical protein FWH18_10715 [Marinilabiliaceae bacterium]|nr:hypothetical protein [Marinilabiliaceae bacterium]